MTNNMHFSLLLNRKSSSLWHAVPRDEYCINLNMSHQRIEDAKLEMDKLRVCLNKDTDLVEQATDLVEKDATCREDSK